MKVCFPWYFVGTVVFMTCNTPIISFLHYKNASQFMRRSLHQELYYHAQIQFISRKSSVLIDYVGKDVMKRQSVRAKDVMKMADTGEVIAAD